MTIIAKVLAYVTLSSLDTQWIAFTIQTCTKLQICIKTRSVISLLLSAVGANLEAWSMPQISPSTSPNATSILFLCLICFSAFCSVLCGPCCNSFAFCFLPCTPDFLLCLCFWFLSYMLLCCLSPPLSVICYTQVPPMPFVALMLQAGQATAAKVHSVYTKSVFG